MKEVATPETEDTQRAKRFETIRGLAFSILINAVLPYIIYMFLKANTQATDFQALIASSVPPIIDSIINVIRKGHIDIIAGISLLGIAVSIVLILLGGSPRLYLIRESFFTVAVGLAYLISLFFPRPMAFYFGRAFATGNVPEKVEWFNSLWQYPNFRKTMVVTTVVWGVGFLLEAVIRTILVFTLTIPQFLIISPFVIYGFIGMITAWTILYSRAARKRSEGRGTDQEGTSVEPVGEQRA